MYKLIVFAVILSLAAAYPSILAPATIIAHPAIVKVAIPAAVSHASISQIHAPVVSHVLAAPVPLLATSIHAHPAPILVHG